MTDKHDAAGDETWSILVSPTTDPYLPPEIWATIFSGLSAKDLIAVTNACPEWDELLVTEKTCALLEMALPILSLTPNDILNCRKVSRGFKKSVDKAIEEYVVEEKCSYFEHELSISHRDFNYAIQEMQWAFNFSSFYTERRHTAQEFLAVVGESRKCEYNPFLSRSLVIPINLESVAYAAMERMLTLYGHHVLAVSIIINFIEEDNEEDDDQEWVEPLVPTKNIPRLLKLLPNLRILDVSSRTEWNEELLIPEELPELKHLVSLSFERWVWGTRGLPLAFLRRYGPQLTSWVDTIYDSILQMDELTTEVLNELLPNIRKLKALRGLYSALPKLTKVNWMLEELTLGDFHEWTIKDFNAILNNFSQTLVQLRLPDASGIWDDYCPNSLCKALTNLKFLELDIHFGTIGHYHWIWNQVDKMCGHMKEIHFVSNNDIAEHLSTQTINYMFQKLLNLNSIFKWSLLQNDDDDHDDWPSRRVLQNVYTRPAI